MNSKTNTVRAILLDASECDRPEADHPGTIEICADDLQRILERHITEPAQCLHQIAEPAAPVVKPIKDAIDALVMAAFTEGGCSEHRMSEARIQTELRKKELRTLLSTPQPCSRSHPHEEMTPMCELRTEIARLTNALARANAAAPQAVQPAVPFMHGIADGCGNAYFEEGCVAPEARDLQPEVDGLNSCLDDDERPYSVVPLYTQPAAQGLHSQSKWEEMHTLPTCDDLIWLYCQDTNTIDGPIAPDPSLEQYGWTHWAYANAPSTAGIDAAQAKQGGAA